MQKGVIIGHGNGSDMQIDTTILVILFFYPDISFGLLANFTTFWISKTILH
jgi:hypothetical protein